MIVFKILHYGLLLAALFASFSDNLPLATFLICCATYVLFHAVAMNLTDDGE